MKFAKYTFWIAAIYGFLALIPQYFLENKIGIDNPPAITHPEYFYGFIGVALAWQLAFIIIARNPVKYRMLMIPAIFEKLSFAVATSILFSQDRLAAQMFGAGVIDLIFGILFVIAYFKTPAK
jgi:hypothetical protein